MAALGVYDGANTEAEHVGEAARLGGEQTYRVRMVNALLGVVQAEALLCETVELDDDARHAAWEQQLDSAGAGEDPAARVEFIRWQVLQAATPLRMIAQNEEVGPIPLAAAHAAQGLQQLLGVIAVSQGAVAGGDVQSLAAQTPLLHEAREALGAAITNTDILLDLLDSLGA